MNYEEHNKQVLADLKRLLAKAKDKDIDRMVFRITNAIKNSIIKNKLRGQVLNVRTGGLIQGFSVKGARAKYTLRNRMIYAAIHEFGGVIKPVRAKYLQFKTANGWVRTKEVHMPERSYIRSTIEEKWTAINKLAAQFLWEEINASNKRT